MSSSQYDNIPDELKSLPQWIVWKYEDIGAAKPTKVPYNAKTGTHASVTDPHTWTDFGSALNAVGDYNGLGFVFSDSDPFSGIDLDDTAGDQVALDRQIKIYHEFDSYSEISPSGKGLHVVVKGIVPQGRRRSNIEIYSSQRYFTMTGNVYPSTGQSRPIVERQSMLMQLWEQMGAGAPAIHIFKGDDSEKQTDVQVIEQAANAANGEKFKLLNEGEWQSNYKSQSEADFAFIDIVAFYTQNRNQIQRIFRQSKLGSRDKAKRNDYLNWMINKSFDRMLPPLDFDGFKIAIDKAMANDQIQKNVSSSNNNIPINGVVHNVILSISNQSSSLILPPGLLGEIAQFIYQAAPRPVPEIALAAAIGLMAGVTGRAFNISGTGLNQYVLLLAKTGRGKESAASGIDKLMNSIKMQVPTSPRFRGPAIINSGQALVKHLAKTSNCFVSVLGEFGITIDRISNKYANSADKMLYQMLLDLYNKSGHGQTLQGSIYSKSEDSVGLTENPALSIVGESTPKIFHSILNEDMISMGLLPRFLIIEYSGERVELNEGHESIQPSMPLVERFASLVAYCETIMYKKSVISIACDDEARLMLRDYDKKTTKQINFSSDDVIAELWNRAHMKVMRLSGLLAVGVNMNDPIITAELVKWSMGLIERDIKMLSSKFESGEIGANTQEIKQINEMIRVIREYVVKDWDYVSKYSSHQKMHYEKVIPYVYLNKRLANNAAFKNDKIGATNALKKAMQTLVDSDKIREVGRAQLVDKYGTIQKAFVVSNTDILKE